MKCKVTEISLGANLTTKLSKGHDATQITFYVSSVREGTKGQDFGTCKGNRGSNLCTRVIILIYISYYNELYSK